jgi:hypothetical protein
METSLFELAKSITRSYNSEVFLKEALSLLRRYRDESLLPEEKDEVVNKAIALLSMCENNG